MARTIREIFICIGAGLFAIVAASAQESSPPAIASSASRAAAVNVNAEIEPNLQPLDGRPGQVWHPIWQVLSDNSGELMRAMVLPSFSAEEMISLSEVEDGSVYLDYATFDESAPVGYLLHGRLHDGEKRRTLDQFIPKRIHKPFPAELAWQLNHLWVTELLTTRYVQLPSFITDGVEHIFSASAYARGHLTGVSQNYVPDSYALIQATRLLVEYARATDPKVESKSVESLKQVVVNSSLSVQMPGRSDAAHAEFVRLFKEWKEIMDKPIDPRRSLEVFVGLEQALKLGKLAANETRFLSMQLYGDLRVLKIFAASPELMEFAKVKGVKMVPESITEEIRSEWLKILRDWDAYEDSRGR